MKMMNVITRKATLAIVSVLAIGSMAQAADQWVLNLSGGKVDFHAIGKPKMLKIHGKGGSPKGAFAVNDGKVTGKAVFDLNSLDTGIDMRNSHMKEKYLETNKHPNATFEITEIKLPNPMPAGDFEKDVPFKGKLTVKGVPQVISGTAKLSKAGGTMKGQVEFSTTVKGFQIDIPSFAGITMADEVQVQVEFEGPLKKGGQSLAKK
jgi:polyisoprenoid-binding protein YceI